MKYDLIAIGGGNGGLAVAEKAAGFGKKWPSSSPNTWGNLCE